MTIASISSVSQSLTTRSQRSGSWKMQHGVRRFFVLACISFQTESRLRKSRANARALAPCPTVLTTRPTFSESGSLSMIFLRRCLSFASPIFFETPRSVAPRESFAPGIMTRYRPGMERFATTRGPFVEIGPFVTWTMISDPGGKSFAISASERRFAFLAFFPRPASSSSSRMESASGVMSQ